MTILTMNDARKAGLCVTGLRAWCQENGVDMKDAVRNGITSEFLIESGNQALLDLLMKSRGE